MVNAHYMMVAGDVSGAVYVGGSKWLYPPDHTDLGWGVIDDSFMAKYQ